VGTAASSWQQSNTIEVLQTAKTWAFDPFHVF
jgi:hypothetical protein